jgi:hypothetical protein
MARQRRRKLSPPTDDDIASAITEGLQISAIAPRIEGRHLFLKMASLGGRHFITFALDPIKADYLRRILNEALPAFVSDASPTRWATDADPQAYGTVPRSILRDDYR